MMWWYHIRSADHGGHRGGEPQILQEIAAQVPITQQERVLNRAVVQVVDASIHQLQDEILVVFQRFQPERISECIVEQIVSAAVLAGSSSSSHPLAADGFSGFSQPSWISRELRGPGWPRTFPSFWLLVIL